MEASAVRAARAPARGDVRARVERLFLPPSRIRVLGIARHSLLRRRPAQVRAVVAGWPDPWIYRGSARLCGGIQRPTRPGRRRAGRAGAHPAGRPFAGRAELGAVAEFAAAASRRGGRAGLALAGIARQPHVPHTVDARGSGVPAGRRQNGDADARSGVLRPLHRLRDRRRLGLSAPSAGGPAAFLSPRRVDAGDLQCAGRGVAPARHPHSRAGVHVRPDHAAAHMG